MRFSISLFARILNLLSKAGILGVIIGSAYIADCRRFGNSIERLQSCYTLGGSMAGVGFTIDKARKKGQEEGFDQGYKTYNPDLHKGDT
jgi:hypothetical protein